MKAVLFGLWLCVCSAAGAFIPRPAAEPDHRQETPRGAFLSLPVVTTELLAVTDIRGPEIVGYFLTRVSVVLDDREASRFAALHMALARDALFGVIETSSLDKAVRPERIDIGWLRNAWRDEINRLAGRPLAVRVLVQQVDYLQTTEIRKKSADRALLFKP